MNKCHKCLLISAVMMHQSLVRGPMLHEITLLHPPRLLWITTKQPLNELAHFDVDQAEKVRLRWIERVIQIEYPVADMGKARTHGRCLMIRGAVGKAISQDRKSVVEGKSVSVRVDHGGRGSLKKQNQHDHYINKQQI